MKNPFNLTSAQKNFYYLITTDALKKIKDPARKNSRKQNFYRGTTPNGISAMKNPFHITSAQKNFYFLIRTSAHEKNQLKKDPAQKNRRK